MPLRIYVAASSRELPRAKRAMQAVRNYAHEVTHDWCKPIEETRALGLEEHELGAVEAREYAEADLIAIERADVVWMLAPNFPTEGFWVELGYALRASKAIVISGATTKACRKNIFLFCRGVHVVLREEDDEASAMAFITRREWQAPSPWWESPWR